jgi:hypothetical protein
LIQETVFFSQCFCKKEISKNQGLKNISKININISILFDLKGIIFLYVTMEVQEKRKVPMKFFWLEKKRSFINLGKQEGQLAH